MDFFLLQYIRTNIFVYYFSRLRKTRSRDESSLDNATARKELNPNSEIHLDVFPTLRNPRSPGQIQTIQQSFQSKVHESKKQQYQPRDHSKRLKARSIAGSTYEVDDNDIHEIIHESIPEEDKGPIYIKPVYRVTTKKTIFDSIADILRQLLDSPKKKELGPIVGPIKMPGSKRKIYLRLLEPIDSSHVNVRFVTEIPAPVIDEEYRKHESFLSYLPFIDPSVTLLQKHPVESNDPIFTSSSNRHHSIQLPRNTSHISDKNRGSQSKPAVKRPSKNFKDINKENVSPQPVEVETASGVEKDKNHLYYQYQSGDDTVKHVTEVIKNTTKNEQDTTEPWYQLTTHRLPLRQIAPLYPLSAMEHTDFSSYENTYKVPSDSHISPSHYSSLYEQYSDVNAAPGFYDQSYNIPHPYSTTYQKQNEFSNAPSSYPISYQNQNEFNNAPSPTSYFKQNDFFNTPTTYTSSHEKPTNVPSLPSSYATSHEAQYVVQTGSSSQNALHVINPPAYLVDSRQVSKNHANKVLEYTMRNDELLPIEQVTWGKVKREKNESNFQKSEEISDNNHEKWQPLMFTSEDTDLQKAVANLPKIASNNHYETFTKQQLVNAPTPSTIETKRFNQRRNVKRHNPLDATIRNSRCLTSDKGDKCERTESTSVSTPQLEPTIKIVQPQSIINVESFMITPRSVASSTVETLKSNVVTKSSWIEESQKLMMTIESFATNSTTERSSTLIKMIKNTTEPIKNEVTLSGSMLSNLSMKSRASSTTERLPINGTSEASISKSTTRRRQMSKRPMLMKKPSFVFRGTEANSTTRKSTMSSTTEKTKTTKRSKYRSAISKIKSSTT